MRAKDYIKEFKDDIKYLDVVERVIDDLYKLRHNESRTDEYHSRILTPDRRYEKLPNKASFVYNDGEIDRKIAFDLRFHLLNIVERDKSFGYIFYLLASERIKVFPALRLSLQNITPNESIINAAIKFDWDDVVEHIESLNNDTEKIRYLIKRKTESEQCGKDHETKRLEYKEELDVFAGKCQFEIDAIKELMTLQDNVCYTNETDTPSSPVTTKNKKLGGDNVGSRNEDGTNIYKYNESEMTKVYDFCKNTSVFSLSCVKFLNAIQEADFKDIFNHKKTTKSKLQYIIYIINLMRDSSGMYIPDKWYDDAVKSIGKKKGACSGANVGTRADEWKKKACGLISDKSKQPKSKE